MASSLQAEVISNFEIFKEQWPTELSTAQTKLSTQVKTFELSYIRISSIQAWRTSIIFSALSEEAEAFFFEAQNDFLVSHCLASCGSFRQGLKAIRGAIENVFFSLYYMDHPVELVRWTEGRHKLGFTEMCTYLENHPLIYGQKLALTAIGVIKDEYSTLSKAVHGSAKVFRMTKNLTEINLWGDDAAHVGKWATRERLVIVNLNVILLHLFRNHLLGAKHRGLRESIGMVFPKSLHTQIKSNLSINLIP